MCLLIAKAKAALTLNPFSHKRIAGLKSVDQETPPPNCSYAFLYANNSPGVAIAKGPILPKIYFLKNQINCQTIIPIRDKFSLPWNIFSLEYNGADSRSIILNAFPRFLKNKARLNKIKINQTLNK